VVILSCFGLGKELSLAVRFICRHDGMPFCPGWRNCLELREKAVRICWRKWHNGELHNAIHVSSSLHNSSEYCFINV
jgi:hypothetical protein